MEQVNDISGELKNIGSKLADVPGKMPYAVPCDYFEKTPADFLQTIIELNAEAQTPEWGKQMPYEVPAGYFNNFVTEVAVAAQASEVLSSIPSAVPFHIPEGYFTTLPGKVLQAAKAETLGMTNKKTIPVKRITIPMQLRWAAAAMLLMGLGFGSYRILSGNNNPERILASVPATDIQDYLQRTSRVDVSRVVNGIDLAVENNDIVQYLNETGWDAAE